MRILLTSSRQMENKNSPNRRHTNNTQNEQMDRKFSQTNRQPQIRPDGSKEEMIKDYNRRHSCLIAVSKLDNNTDMSLGNQLEPINGIIKEETHQGKIHQKRKHKGS